MLSNKTIRLSLFLALYIALIQIITFGLFNILTKNIPFLNSIKIIFFIITAFISAFLIVIVILNTIPYLKKFFITERSLLRYQSLSNPLLLKLSTNAPGTYHHSLQVANLAYKAAQAIKADAILARTGAYYHDIGKLEDPLLFIENQSEKENDLIIKNATELKKIAQKIINHVNYGLKLAKENNLPPELMAFIAEHHGTTSPLFFILKIKEKNPKISTKELIYPGPKPLSIESAIVMLADAIEATLRIIKNIEILEIEKVVDQIINERIEQNQLNLSGLNSEKIKKIRNSFINTLSTIHHQRINYGKNKA